MTSIQIVWLTILLPVSLIAFGMTMFYGSVMFHRIQNHSFDIRSEFPFEFMDGRESGLRLGRAFLLIWAIVDVALSAYLLVSLQAHQFLLWMSIIFTVSILLRDVCFFLLFCIPAFQFKPHFFAFVSSSGLTAFSSAVAVIICFNAREHVGALAIVFAVLFALVGLFAMLIMVNPKLANWAKLDSSIDESGAVVEKRPKYFVLAFSEWLVILSGLILSVATTIGFALFDIL